MGFTDALLALGFAGVCLTGGVCVGVCCLAVGCPGNLPAGGACDGGLGSCESPVVTASGDDGVGVCSFGISGPADELWAAGVFFRCNSLRNGCGTIREVDGVGAGHFSKLRRSCSALEMLCTDSMING